MLANAGCKYVILGVKDAIPELKLNIDKLDLDYIGFKNYQILD